MARFVKPPASAFVLYCNATRAQLRATHPELTTSRQIGEAHAAGWKQLSDKEVCRYEELAAADKRRYDTEVGERDSAQSSNKSSFPELSTVFKIFGSVSSNKPSRSRAFSSAEEAAADQHATDLTYGEFDLDFFAQLLLLASPRTGEAFIDLGSGCGRVTCAAAVLHPTWRIAYGVEMVAALHEEALHCHRELLAECPTIAPCRFVHDRAEAALPQLFGRYDGKEAAAVVVFVYATLWQSDGLKLTALSELLGTTLPHGSRVIVIDKHLVSGEGWAFEQIHHLQGENTETGRSKAWVYKLSVAAERPPPYPLVALRRLSDGSSAWVWAL